MKVSARTGLDCVRNTAEQESCLTGFYLFHFCPSTLWFCVSL